MKIRKIGDSHSVRVREAFASAKASACAERLRQRPAKIWALSGMSGHTEISRKQSEVYFKYAQDLIKQRRQINLARSYLKASLKIDPHDRQRWETVNREFNRIDRMII